MSGNDFFAPTTGVVASPMPPGEPTPQPRPRQKSRRGLVASLAVVALVLTGFTALHFRTGPSDNRPVVLPDTLAGLQPATGLAQFADHGDWRTSLAHTFGEHPFDGRAFRAPATGVEINLVVVRTDSSDIGDPHLARPPFLMFGEVRCTHSIQFGDQSPQAVPEMLICWRARDTLTVSILTLRGGLGFEEQAAQAVQEVWDMQH